MSTRSAILAACRSTPWAPAEPVAPLRPAGERVPHRALQRCAAAGGGHGVPGHLHATGLPTVRRAASRQLLQGSTCSRCAPMHPYYHVLHPYTPSFLVLQSSPTLCPPFLQTCARPAATSAGRSCVWTGPPSPPRGRGAPPAAAAARAAPPGCPPPRSAMCWWRRWGWRGWAARRSSARPLGCWRCPAASCRRRWCSARWSWAIPRARRCAYGWKVGP